MRLPTRHAVVALAAAAAASLGACAGAPSPAAKAGAPPLRVCLLAHAAPLSDRASGGGLDVDVMSAVATQLGVGFEPVWIENAAVVTEVDEGDLPLVPLARGRCDAVASVPGEAALREAGDALELTRAYYGAAFELVGGEASDLAELRGRTVAVQAQTVAHYALQGSGVRWISRSTPAEAVAALDAGAADAALVWGPALGPLSRTPAAGWQAPQGLRWNEHVAVRASDAALARRIDDALAALAARGEIARLARAHGVPDHAPFDTTSNAGALAALGVGGRGRP
ncbi:MAG TPA: transporter substrate-binding domain-containing protein [Myxococcota bacterium]|nr:transporter substrate-binding domain-containing protein [Myxococcota bacterium]